MAETQKFSRLLSWLKLMCNKHGVKSAKKVIGKLKSPHF